MSTISIVTRRIPATTSSLDRKIDFKAGQLLVGHRFRYRLKQEIRPHGKIQSTLWLAEVLAGRDKRTPAELAVVKTADPEKWPLLKKEFDAYQGPCIRESPWIRRFYDHVNSYKDPTSYKDQTQFESAAVVEPFGLILEYMDTTLEKVDPELHKRRPQFMKAVFEAQMKGTRDIHQDGLVWTDAQPANVLCSHVDGPSPIVKLADLGSCRKPTLDPISLQPFAMRSPETWTGWGNTYVSDVWAIGANILCWLKPGILGDWGFNGPQRYAYIFADAWCMAKVRRLFETDDDKMPSANPKKEQQLDGVVRDILDRRREPQEGVDVSLPTPTSKQLLQELDVSNEVKAVLSRFFIIDHTSRATSAQLLQSEEFKTLEAAAR